MNLYDPQTIISKLRTRPTGERLHRWAGAAVTAGNGKNADASFPALEQIETLG